MRSISFSEISAALDCQAKWDMRYGDTLAGSSLKRKELAPGLSLGRAWGAGVAAWHEAVGRCIHEQLRVGVDGSIDMEIAPDQMADSKALESLWKDAERQREVGTWDEQQHAELAYRVEGLLQHYIATTEAMPLEALEAEYEVPILSRGGQRKSTKYRLQAYVDGRSVREGVWLVEFKLRKSLLPVGLIIRSRQIRWYAWAHWQATGEKPVGVIVDERLNEVPKAPRILKNGKVSTDKRQFTTVDWYCRACRETGTEIDQEMVDALRNRVWHHRVPVLFVQGELEEAGKELVSAARMIGDLDSGVSYPLRNAKRGTCSYCDFDEICDFPRGDHVGDLFTLVPAKRDRKKEESVGT